MAERGPLPKPNARRRNKREVHGNRVLVQRPTMPKTLTGEAREEWRRIVPQLEAMGLLSKIDRGSLIRYCTVWADWCEIDASLQKTGKLLRGRQGFVRNPLWLMRRDAEEALEALSRQLGLSPVARIRAGVVHEAPVTAEDEGERPISIDERRRALQG